MTDQLDNMLQLAITARKYAYAPYSKFLVGVCLRTENNKLFSGCNVENASYGLTLCAEATAIGSMVTAGDQSIAEIVIVGSPKIVCTPCGACRQRLWEFGTLETSVHLCREDKIIQTILLSELFSHPFDHKKLEQSK